MEYRPFFEDLYSKHARVLVPYILYKCILKAVWQVVKLFWSNMDAIQLWICYNLEFPPPLWDKIKYQGVLLCTSINA